ncbi:hypothetical protein RJ55_02677 [Drechmeria coniospora]|nr:hypothetical protein RJ55_02677 [Drechmeria coniospora]
MESSEPLDRCDSQQTAMSLLELDPSPMESPSSPESDGAPAAASREASDRRFPTVQAASCSSTAGAPGLRSSNGGGRSRGHGAIFYLTRVQRYSSYAMSVFTLLHLTNVSLIPAVTRSVAGSETYLLMTREIYQTSVTEPLLVALPVVAHVGSGVALRLLRRRQMMKRYGEGSSGTYALYRLVRASSSKLWPSLSYISMSGYAFAVFYSAHVLANRLLPLAVEGDSSNIGLAYIAHGFARHPTASWLAYVGLLAVGCGHMVWGAREMLLGPSNSTGGWRGSGMVTVDKNVKRQRRRKWLTVHGVALTVAGLWAVGGLGVVARGGAAEGWIAKLSGPGASTVAVR